MQETDLPVNRNQSSPSPSPISAQKRSWPHFWLYFLAGGVFSLDQLVKLWTEQTLAPANSGKSIQLLGGQFRLIYIKNSGASFGMLKDVPWLFALLAIGASIGIIIWYEVQKPASNGLRLGVGLILGGIVGNLSDRLFKGGSVTDMLNFPGIELFRIFNVADTAITFGVIAVLLTFLLKSREEAAALKVARAQKEHKQ